MEVKTKTETERKFLVRSLELHLLPETTEKIDIVNFYLKPRSDGSEARLTVYEIDGNTTFWYVQKGKRIGISRQETVEQINFLDFLAMYDYSLDKTLTPVCKTRYKFDHLGKTFELDDFSHIDLQLLEIELVSENEPFVLPPFVDIVKDVTNDESYYNRNIAARLT